MQQYFAEPETSTDSDERGSIHASTECKSPHPAEKLQGHKQCAECGEQIS
jgi:hypothetical protein